MTRIGITASQVTGDDGELHADVVPYVRAVRAAGAEPVVFAGPADPAAVLGELDGFVLSGGVDVDPVRYGGRREHARSQAGSYRAERDELEIALARLARAQAVPVLCICRGVQVANVAFGGTLFEDVREAFGERYRIHHRQTYEDGRDRSDYADGHEVALEPDSAIAAIAGTLSLPTNSMHHQALRDVSPDLRVVGRTSDGVIEACEAAFAHPFFLGVQWHPEELDDAPNRALFAALVRAAASVQPERARA